MDVAYINPFIAATREVLSTMVKVPVSAGAPYLCHPGDRHDRIYQLSAVIGLTGSIAGFAVLSVAQPTARAIVKELLGELPKLDSEIDAACLDALGEVASMICGSAKKNLPGGLVKISTPKTSPTKNVNYPPAIPIIGIPFDAGVGKLSVTISFRQTPATPDNLKTAGA